MAEVALQIITVAIALYAVLSKDAKGATTVIIERERIYEKVLERQIQLRDEVNHEPTHPALRESGSIAVTTPNSRAVRPLDR